MLACALVLSSLIFSSPLVPDATVSYETRAKTIPRILAELSQLEHVNLTAAPELANEPLIIHVDQVPLNDLLKKIGEASCGSWVSEGGHPKLIFDQSRFEQEMQTNKAARIKGLEEGLSTQRDLISQGPITIERALKMAQEIADSTKTENIQTTTGGTTSDGPIASYETDFVDGPATCASARALLTLGAEKLAALPPGRYVYSDQPTLWQQPVGADGANILAQFKKDCAVWSAGFAQVRAHRNIKTATDSEGDPLIPSPRAENAVKFDLMVETSAAGPPNIEIRFYDKEGKVVDEDHNGILDLNGPLQEDSFAKKGLPKTRFLDLTDDAKHILRLFMPRVSAEDFSGSESLLPSPARSIDISSALKSQLLKPSEFDPLYWAQSEIAIGVAKHREQQLVASVPDDLFLHWYETIDRVDLDNPIMLQVLCSLKEESNWLIVTPLDRAEAMSNRANRGNLQILCSALSQPRTPAIEAIGAYLLGAGGQDEISDKYKLVALSPMKTAESYPVHTLRVFASLTQLEQNQLEGGKSISLADLSDGQRQELTRALLANEFSRPQTEQESEGDTHLSGFDQETILDEPTERWPQGLPETVTITGKQTETPIVFGGGTQPPYSPENLAMMRLGVITYPSGKPTALPKTFVCGILRELVVNLSLGDTPLGDVTLSETQIRDPKEVTYDELPATFRAAVDKAEKELKDSLGHGGGTSRN
jgi:hypothetical protein